MIISIDKKKLTFDKSYLFKIKTLNKVFLLRVEIEEKLPKTYSK